jgi:hypothetical protein
VSEPLGRWVPDKLSPSGFRWQRYDEQPPTNMLPMTPELNALHGDEEDEQEDLSHLDQSAGELVNTEKLGPLDEVLVQPSQDPSWHPEDAA